MSSLGQPAFGSFPVPTIGSLHSHFVDLPANATCEVLLSVRTSSVNPSDISPRVSRDDFPKVLGSDAAGVITATTGDCTRLKVGDRVWGDIGANTATKAGKTKELGGYGPTAVALEAQLATIPGSLSFAQAGVLPKVALTTWKAFTWYAGAPAAQRWARDDATVLVLGGSGARIELKARHQGVLRMYSLALASR